MPAGWDTVELDEELLARAKQLLSLKTTRQTIEESLRRVVEEGEAEESERERKQRAFFDDLSRLVDLDVLGSDEMWR